VAKIDYSPSAQQDLEQIGDYIKLELCSPAAALNTVNSIQDSIDSLSAFPLLGAHQSSIVDVDTDYRFLVCGNYLAFYRTDEITVCIDRIIYGKRDYMTILFPKISGYSSEH